ncbi:MAG: ATP-binding protein, partial [Saprospiraceae bacterium]
MNFHLANRRLARALLFALSFAILLPPRLPAQQQADSLAALLKTSIPDTSRTKILAQLADLHINQGTPLTALQSANDLLAFAEKIRDTSNIIAAKAYLFKIYFNLIGDYKQAAQHAQQMLALAEQRRDTLKMVRANTFVGIGFLQEVKNLTDAKQNADQQVAEAIKNFQRASDLYQAKGKALQVAKMQAKIGDVYNVLGQPEKSIQYYQAYMEMAKASGDNFELMTASIQVAGAMREFKTPDKMRQSIAYYEQALRLAGSGQTDIYERIFCLQSMAHVHGELGNFEQSYRTYLTYMALRDTLLTKERAQQIGESEAKYAAEFKKTEVAQKNLQLEQQAATRDRLLFAAALALLAIFGYFSWRRTRQKAEQARAELQAQLEHAEADKLRELDQFKSRFFTNITHEFRTPLTVILGNADLMKNEIPAASQPKLKAIQRNSEGLLRLINQLLDLAKLEDQSLRTNQVQGDVVAYTTYNAESFQSFANSKNLVIRTENPSGQAQIFMDYDPERFGQILQNLLSNALKFTPSGGSVTLRTDLTTFEKAPNLTLSVSDTGAGISPEDLPHIFNRFFQAKNQGKEGGTGIGLALTKELVQLMGGEISVESAVGKGTTFTVRLPITNIAPIEELKDRGFEELKTETSAIASSTNPQILDSSNPQILIVEDNPDVVDYLSQCLSGKFRLEYAFNGRSGIEKALEIVPELIVSDVMMPEKDGFELTDTLKNDPRTSHIPIVLLTARADVESRIAGLRRGADSYLAKPFYPEELTVTLEKLLENRQRMQARYSQIALGMPSVG